MQELDDLDKLMKELINVHEDLRQQQETLKDLHQQATAEDIVLSLRFYLSCATDQMLRPIF